MEATQARRQETAPQFEDWPSWTPAAIWGRVKPSAILAATAVHSIRSKAGQEEGGREGWGGSKKATQTSQPDLSSCLTNQTTHCSPTPLPKRDANEIQIEELKALSFLSLTIDNNSKSEAYFNLFTNKTLFFTSMKIWIFWGGLIYIWIGFGSHFSRAQIGGDETNRFSLLWLSGFVVEELGGKGQWA